MRRLEILFSLCFVLVGGQALSAQTLWSPYGCSNQCNSGCAGCQTNNCGHQSCFMECLTKHDPDYFESYDLRPFGSYNDHIMQTQRHHGIVAQFVFHHFDFSFNEANGTWGLSQTGSQNAQKLARLWAATPAKVLVEPTGRGDWDNTRREIAWQALVANGINCNSSDVVLGNSHILGLVPTEPETIYNRRQQPSPFNRAYSPSTSFGSGAITSGASSTGGAGGSN